MGESHTPPGFILVIVLFLVGLAVLLFWGDMVSAVKGPIVNQTEFSKYCWMWYNNGCKLEGVDIIIENDENNEVGNKLEGLCDEIYGGTDRQKCKNACSNACIPIGGD